MAPRFDRSGRWGLAFLLSGLAEEFLFRGYAQFTLTTGMGFWPSAFLLSGLFGLVHASNGGENRFGRSVGGFVRFVVVPVFSAGLEIYGVRSAFTWDMTGGRRSCTVFK